MQKIAILGSPGSGKSTFARQLGAILQIPITHLDRILWHPNWEDVSPTQWQYELATILQQPHWIIDGFHPDAIDLYLPMADAIVLLDLHPLICVQRAIARYLHHSKDSRPDLPGYKEVLEWDRLKGIWFYPKTTRSLVLQKIQQYEMNQQFHRLRTTSAIQIFLENESQSVHKQFKYCHT